MRTIINIVSIFKEYLVLAACILLSIFLLTGNDNAQIRSIRSVTVVAIGMAEDLFGFIPNFFSLRKENSILRERNVSLADEVSLLRESKLENFRLRQMLVLKERSPFGYRAAHVVGKNQQPMRATITLDVGSNDGVKENMPIVSEAGLAGKIIGVGPTYSVGQLLLHKEFRVGVRVQSARADGILFWDGEQLRMKNVPRTAAVNKGDVIITSTFSSVYPAGIRIGLVSSVFVKPGALFHTITVEPATDFSTLEEVFVVTYVPDSARVALEQQFEK